MLDTKLYVAADPEIVSQILDDEAVLLLPAKGEIKVLNTVGAQIWSLADGSRTIAEIASEIATEYAVTPDQAQADTLAFVAELAQRGMVALSAQPGDPATNGRR